MNVYSIDIFYLRFVSTIYIVFFFYFCHFIISAVSATSHNWMLHFDVVSQ